MNNIVETGVVEEIMIPVMGIESQNKMVDEYLDLCTIKNEENLTDGNDKL